MCRANLQTGLRHTDSATEDLGIRCCQTGLAADIPYPVLQQGHRIQFDAIPVY